MRNWEYRMGMAAIAGWVVVSGEMASAQESASPAGDAKRFEGLPAAVREEFPTEAARIVAELANEDPLLAIDALKKLKELRTAYVEEKDDLTLLRNSLSRGTSYVEKVVGLAWEDIDGLTRRFELLRQLLKDAPLANELEFYSLHFAVYEDAIPKFSREEFPDIDERREAHRDHEIEELAGFCKAAPEDLPPIVLLPGIKARLGQMNWGRRLLTAMKALKNGADELDRVEGESSATPPELLKEINDSIPARFHEVVELAEVLQSGEMTEQTFLRVVALAENANLPITARLSLAAEAFLNDFWDAKSSLPLPQSLRIQLADWLAEAWEVHAVTSSGEKILRLFLYGDRGDDWSRMARKILAAWNQRISRIEEAASVEGNLYLLGPIGYLVCLAAETDDAMSLARLTEMLQRVGDPLSAFALLVRSGEHEAAWGVVANQQARVFFRRGHASVSFDPVLAGQVEKFIGRIGNPELRYLIELHLKILVDSRFGEMKPSREERIVDIAKRFGDAEFTQMEPKYTALRLIAEVPEASGVIAEEYVAFANLERVRQHHQGGIQFGFHFNWSELAGDMMSALLAAKDYQQAAEVLEQIAAGTAPIDPRDVFRRHEETWELLAEAVLAHATPRDGEALPRQQVAQLLPIFRFLVSLPALFFDKHEQRLRGRIFAEDLRFHDELDRKGEWWTWRQSLNPKFRADLDFQFLNHLYLVRKASGDDEPDEDALLKPYLFIVQAFEQTPFDRPFDERLAAIKPRLKRLETMTPGGESLAPRAIKVLRKYGYFSDDELRRCAFELAEVMGYPDDAWSDLRISGVSKVELEAAGMKNPNPMNDQ